jgi:excisionase family DNA binding protein
MKKTDNKDITGDHWINNPRNTNNKLLPRLLSMAEAARYMSLSYWTIRDLIATGQLPKVVFGKRILVDIQDLNALIEKNKTREPVL